MSSVKIGKWLVKLREPTVTCSKWTVNHHTRPSLLVTHTKMKNLLTVVVDFCRNFGRGKRNIDKKERNDAMFCNECTISLRIKKLEILLQRLPYNHPVHPEVVAEYKSRMAGYRGEKSLLFYLNMPRMKNITYSMEFVFYTKDTIFKWIT